VGSRGSLTSAIAALVGALALASLTGCEGTVAMDEMPAQPSVAAAAAPTAAPTPTPTVPPVVTVAPQDGETVALGSEVAVSVANGTLTAVSAKLMTKANANGMRKKTRRNSNGGRMISHLPWRFSHSPLDVARQPPRGRVSAITVNSI